MAGTNTTTDANAGAPPLERVVLATGEEPLFAVGESLRVKTREPIGHYRVPRYLRGKTGVLERIIEPKLLDNEREGFGLNAGDRRHYYRLAFQLADLFPGYNGPVHDNLRIEVYEAWLERI